MTVSSSTNRVSYSGNGSLTAFAYTFKVFDESDLTVILRASDGTETVQTITTHYTVSGVGDVGGGNVTFVTAPTATQTVVILREQPLTQGLDLVPNDPFPANSLEEALDKIVFMTQKHEEELGRAIKASRTNTISGAEFTISASDRANKIFAFDSSGDVSITQEIGTFRGNWATSTAYEVRDLVKDTSTNNIFIVNSAHTSSGAQPLTTNANSAKYDLIVDAASATTSATNAAASETAAETAQTAAETAQTAAETAQTAAETAETNAETAQTAAEAAQTAAETAQSAAETAYDNFDDRYLGAKASDPTLDNDGDALIDGALYFDTTNNVMKVYDLGGTAWKRTTPTSAEQTNIDTVSGISANVTTVAGISANVTTVAGISSDVTTVAADGTDIGTVAGISANVTTVAGVSSDVTTVAGISSDVTTVSGISANVTTVAGVSANVTTVAGVSADVTTVAGISANVTTVATNDANVTTVATNITGVNSFAERYRVGSSDPTTSLDEGDLAYNSTSNLLKYYNGTSWQSISPGIGAVSDDSNPSLGGVLSTSGNNIEFGDSTGAEVNRLKLGAGDDLQIYHDGTYNYIEAGSTTSTDLRIISTDDIIIGHGTPTSYETMAAFLSDGSVNLYYDNYQKLNTNSTGVNVNGTLFADYVDASPTVRTSSSDSGSQGTKYLKLATLNAFSPSTSNSLFIIDVILEGRSDPQGCQAFRLYLRAADTASDSRFEVEDLRVQDYSNVSSLYSESNFHWYWNSQSNQELWIQIPNSSDTSFLEAFTRLVSAASQDTSYISGYEDLTLQTGQSWTTSNPSGSNRITAEFVTKRFKDLHLDNGIKYAADLSKRIEFTTSGSDIVADVTAELRADSYNETYAAVTSSSNSTTVNCHNGNAFSHTLTENTTFTFSNPPPSGNAYSFSIEIIQDSSASGYTVTWPSSVDWPSATAPTLTATASAKDVFVFYTRDGGTNWYGFTAGQALG